VNKKQVKKKHMDKKANEKRAYGKESENQLLLLIYFFENQ